MNDDFRKVMSGMVNDNYLQVYIGNIVKEVVKIHQLLNNRIKGLEDLEDEEVARKLREEKLKKEKEEK